MVSCVITCNASIFPLQLLVVFQARAMALEIHGGQAQNAEKRERREKSFEFWSLLICIGTHTKNQLNGIPPTSVL